MNTNAKEDIIVQFNQHIAYFRERAQTTSIEKDTIYLNGVANGFALAKQIVENVIEEEA